MQTVKTIPGKTYAVESAGEVTITNTETGAIAAQGDGSGQVLFTACSNSYTVSDDAAKVVALFKLAPRLKLSLLQGGAGGWLPKGFTELEYIESSGTQWIITDVLPSERQRIEVTACTNGRVAQMCIIGAHSGSNWNTRVQIFGNDKPLVKNYRVNTINDTLNVPADKKTTSIIDLATQQVFDDGLVLSLPVINAMPTVPYGICARNRDAAIQTEFNLSGRIYTVRSFLDGVPESYFSPVLNADGEPGMWERISGRFYNNDGSGTFGYRIKGADESVAPMSLRDPWRVAPSGVYARRSGENALEILADTEETSGDGWEWFANTAEAYQNFGIVHQEEELLTE